MHLEFFHHKINELWDFCKDMGWSCDRASKSIANAFQMELSDIMKIVENILDNKLDELMQGLAWLYPPCIDIEYHRNEMKKKLLPHWREIDYLKKIRDEFDALKDMENVKKFIETLEELRTQNSRSNRKHKTNNAIDAVDDNFCPHR